MKLRILSLGAGVQSSALAMLIEQGKVPMVDAAIFADVGAEPREVIEWLDWLKTKISYPLFVVQDRNVKMKCFFCDTEVRWNNDFDSEDIDPDSEYTITSYYECDNCKAWYEVSTNKKETK